MIIQCNIPNTRKWIYLECTPADFKSKMMQEEKDGFIYKIFYIYFCRKDEGKLDWMFLKDRIELQEKYGGVKLQYNSTTQYLCPIVIRNVTGVHCHSIVLPNSWNPVKYFPSLIDLTIDRCLNNQALELAKTGHMEYLQVKLISNAIKKDYIKLLAKNFIDNPRMLYCSITLKCPLVDAPEYRVRDIVVPGRKRFWVKLEEFHHEKAIWHSEAIHNYD